MSNKQAPEIRGYSLFIFVLVVILALVFIETTMKIFICLTIGAIITLGVFMLLILFEKFSKANYEEKDIFSSEYKQKEYNSFLSKKIIFYLLLFVFFASAFYSYYYIWL